jgi:hypothetical protein
MDREPSNVISMARLKGHVVDTGQSVEINAPRRRKRKKGWRDHVSMVDVGVMRRLELIGGESRVLYALMAHVPEKGGAEAFATLQQIADELEVSGPYVAQIMKTLRARRIVRTVRQGVHHINTWLAYNGDFDSWNTEAENEPEPVWQRGVDPHTGEMK